MIAELFLMIKMLFGKNPSEKGRVSLLGMNHFPFKGYKYMMWCGYMIYRNDMYDRRQKEWPTDLFRVTENHEQIHLMQAKQCGSWVRYYWKYIVEWLKGNPIIAPSKSAYYTNKYECEAYANEENLNYCKNYDGSNLSKYDFKNRKSLWKKIGNTADTWIFYIKKIK